MGVAAQGTGSNDEERLRRLLSRLNPSVVPFEHGSAFTKSRQIGRVVREIRTRRADLVVAEGTGIAVGVALLISRLGGTPYVVSTGDAVGPFVAAHSRVLGPFFGVYERLLYRLSAGVIGWTPYLAGRALTYGAPRAISVPGWATVNGSEEKRTEDRETVRRSLGIPSDAMVVGIAGTLTWNRQVGYCYGHELVQAALRTDRADLVVLIVGDGTGRAHLEALAGPRLGKSIFFTGRVPRQDVAKYLNALDIGSLPQTRDQLGTFRYSTKLAEYLACGIPIVTSRIPAAYDLDAGWLWRLPGTTPWSETFVAALTAFFNQVSEEDVRSKRAAIPTVPSTFDADEQTQRVTRFISELLEELNVFART